MHLVRHEADEVTQTQGRFENATPLKAEALEERIHRADDDGRGVVGVEGCGASRVQLVGREQRLQAFAFGFPLVAVRVKDLWQPAPTDIADECALVLVVGRHAFAFECEQQFNRGEIGAALLLERPNADFVGVGNAVVLLVSQRLGFGRNRSDNYNCFPGPGFSGGRKMYRSRTCSHAW